MTDFKISQIAAIPHDSEIRFAFFSPDSKHVFTAGCDDTVKIFSRNSDGNWVHTLMDSQSKDISSVEFSPDGRWLAVARYDHTVRVFARDAGGQWQHEQDITHSGSTGRATFSPDGRYLLTADFQNIKVHCIGAKHCWVEETNISQTDIVPESEKISWLNLNEGNPVFSPCGSRFVVRGSEHTVKVYARQDDGVWQQEAHINSHDKFIHAMFSPDGSELITTVWGDAARKVHFYARNPEGDWMKQHSIRYDRSLFTDSCGTPPEISPDGNSIVMTNFSLFETSGVAMIHGRCPDGSWQEKCTIHHRGRIHAAAFSPDSSRVVAVGGDNRARICHRDAKGHWKEVAVIDHGDWVMSACFSPDSNLLMTNAMHSGNTNATKIYGRTADESWVHKATLSQRCRHRFSSAFSPDGSHALTLSSPPPQEAVIWSVQRGKERM